MGQVGGLSPVELPLTSSLRFVSGGLLLLSNDMIDFNIAGRSL